MRPRPVLSLLALPLLALAACDSADDRPGEFDGALSGAVTADLRWGAQFGDGKGLILSDDEGSVTVDTDDFVGVEPGRYAIGIRSVARDPLTPADTFAAALWLRPSDRPTRTYVAESGVLVLDAVSASEVRGSLAFTAVSADDSTQTVEIDGEFRAEYVPFCC